MTSRIRSAIEDLPPRQRQVVTLRDLEGRAYSCAYFTNRQAICRA